MLLGILTLITALSISAVAIYYSVAGLMTIFAAAAIPIMIMGGVLEVGKLVTAVWLHRYWKQATWWLKTYLTAAVVILMFITSMGIFGFLSKAHIEQTASANEGVAQLERIEAEISRNEQIIARAETKIEELETSGTGATNQLQTQIDREQERIAGAYDRIQPAIEEQNQIIAGVTALFQTELDRIDEELARLQGFINNDEIERAQAMVGTAVDGDYGPATARAFTQFQEAKRAERNEWLQKIQDAAQSPTVVAAREEIARLRAGTDEQIAESNALINNLRNQLKSNDGNDLQAMLDEQNERVRTASSEIDTLFEQKFQLEAEYRKLEAEVGPVKYIAEFIYGETADNNLLEEAVRWVIITIIFVFDPLAVLLLIASQYTFNFVREGRNYEITNKEEATDDTNTNSEDRSRNIDGNDIQDSTRVSDQKTNYSEKSKEKINELDPTTTIGARDYGRNPANRMVMAAGDLEYEEFDTYEDITDNGMDRTSDTEERSVYSSNLVENEDEDFDQDQLTDEQLERQEIYKELDEHETVKDLKQQWKAANPDENLKTYKKLYIQGKIDNLPWLESYEQNSEQSENSLWNKIQHNR